MQKIGLSNIAQVLPGYPFRGRLSQNDKGDALALQTSALNEEGGLQQKELIKIVLTGKRKPDWVRNNDIVFVARGENNRSILMRDVPDSVVITPQLFLVRPDLELVTPAFLAWQMNQIEAKKYFQVAAQGSATVSINKSMLTELPISLPSMIEQQRVMQMVDCLKEQQDTIRALELNQQKLMAAIANKVFNSSVVGEGEQK